MRPRGAKPLVAGAVQATQATQTSADRPIKDKRYIVVEGPIGVGKTTLARRIAGSIGADLLLEQSNENPFLERFYRSPSQYALQTQLYFLFQRVQQLKELRQGDLFAPVRIADFMLDKDPLFARLTLDGEELYLYEQVFGQLVLEVPKPDLVIFLQAPTGVLVRRIRKRGILFERNMERGFLEELSDAYTRFFLSYHDSPLLMVNAENSNFLDDEEHFALLLEQVESVQSGRHYFNPDF